MVDDPYRVLGVSRNATQEEIKRAYRKKAKEYHPDLHPNDPEAVRKMNEVNEAYDMLTNPEKYASRRAQQQQQGQYGGYSGQQRQSGGGYQGPGGWASDFGGFSFEDIFGFGFADEAAQNATRPQPQPGDSPEIQRVISAINSGQYHSAVTMLTNIPSTGRNARWYYLSALANHGLGNTVTAADHMQRAVQLDPNNRMYHLLLQQFRRAGQTYARNARGFNMEAADMQRLCLSLCAAQLLCTCCRCV